jgi:small subunit ribosomal protein S16
VGGKKKPYYRVVVIDKSRARDSRFVEIVGQYNPRKEPREFQLRRERIDYWLQKGAQPSETVRSLLSAVPPAPVAEKPPEPAA